MNLYSKRGFTLAEVMIAFAVSLALFAAVLAAYLGVKSLNLLAKHHMQAVEVVRGRVESLKVTAYAAIVNGTTTVSYDAGPDGIFGNADDLQGTLTVTVQDFLDYDGDGKGLPFGLRPYPCRAYLARRNRGVL